MLKENPQSSKRPSIFNIYTIKFSTVPPSLPLQLKTLKCSQAHPEQNPEQNLKNGHRP